MASEIVNLQSSDGPTSSAVSSGTDLILPPVASAQRLAHFPEEVYDLSAESHLVRFLKVLLGDPGAGQLRKRTLANRLQQSIQGVHFYDLDRFYGGLFGVRRSAAEALDVNPYTDSATSETWSVQQAKDASYRSRVTQFARSLAYGATPTGIELVAEALLSVDCDVYESYIQADGSFQTYAELQTLYGSGIADGSYFDGNTAASGQYTYGWLGTAGASASTMTVQGVVLRTNQASVPTPTAAATPWSFTAGTTEVVSSALNTTAGSGPNGSTGFVRYTVTTAKTAAASGPTYAESSSAISGASGATRIASMWIRLSAAATVTPTLTFKSGASVVNTVTGTAVAVSANTWTQIIVTGASTGAFDGVSLLASVPAATILPIGGTYDSTEVVVEAPAAGGTYAQMQTQTYGQLQGSALSRLSGDERRVFIVRPKRPITASEAYELRRVLSALKPADARFTIDRAGTSPMTEVPIRGGAADSTFWEVVPYVTPRNIAGSPYPVPSSTVPVEQPRAPFSVYQGEAWSYLPDVIGVAAFAPDSEGIMQPLPVQRVTLPDGSSLDYPAYQSLTPRRHILAGRAASDGVLNAHPYWALSQTTSPDLAPLTVDRMRLDALNTLLSTGAVDSLPQNPAERYWYSPERLKTDPTPEVMEVSLTHPRLINHLSMDVAHYPHEIRIDAFVDSGWVTLGRKYVVDSVPQYLAPGVTYLGSAQHSAAGHWLSESFDVTPTTTTAVRIVLTRLDGPAPRKNATDEVAYSLALRSLDIGYRVRSLDDVPANLQDGSAAIGQTQDVVGSTVEYRLRQEDAQSMITGAAPMWRCEPQPVNYAVVNFFLDVRDANGDAQVIDRLYLHPTHSGAHLSLYWTEAVGDPSDDWYAAQVWQPIPRDYTVQKGFLMLPPTRARHFKLEFTALNAEQIETLLPIVHTVRLFPRALIDTLASSTAGADVLVGGMSTALAIGDTGTYADALTILRTEGTASQTYDATEALYVANPAAAQTLRDRSWVYGFTPWHQGGVAPRFTQAQVHNYDTVEIAQVNKIGFFVGLFEIKAYRADFSANDDTQIYDEHFHDFRNIQPGFTWTFNPNMLTTGVTSTTVVAQSTLMSSLHDVRALQFATQQTDPVQVAPDDDLRDPALASIDWKNNPDGWHGYGDSVVVYSPQNHSARIARYAAPLSRPGTRSTSLDQRVVHPVFATRTLDQLGGWDIIRNNLATNPRLGVDATNWSAAAGTGGTAAGARDTTVVAGLPSAASYLVTWSVSPTDGTGGLFYGTTPVRAGLPYVASMYAVASIAQTLTLRVDWKDSGGTTLSTTYGSAVAAAAGSVVRPFVAGTAPTGAVNATLSLQASASTNWTVGSTLRATSVLIEQATVVGSYFDGSTTPGSYPDATTYVWLGTADASGSQRLPGPPYGGIQSPLLGVSTKGTIYAAIRMTYLTPPTSPVYVQVISGNTGALIGEFPVTGVTGSAIETYAPFTLDGAGVVKVQAIQKGASNDIFEIDRLSLFDVGILWEFSVDGGHTWVNAEGVRNNANGVVSFPSPGNQLMWRVSSNRSYMGVSALRIRPWYIGVLNARDNGEQRGPNVSAYDAAVPVTEDPMFTTWSGPIPRNWFLAYRQFPSLVLAEGPNVTEFARYYGRPVTDTLTLSDSAARKIIFGRTATDRSWADANPTVLDAVVRKDILFRTASDTAPIASDKADGLYLSASSGGIVDAVVHDV